jgi:hypothetical protein
MKQLKLTIALAAMALFTSTGAHASLLGDSVTLRILNSGNEESTRNTTVGAGVEFSNTVGNSPAFFAVGEFIDITSNSINLNFTGTLQRTFEFIFTNANIASVIAASSSTPTNAIPNPLPPLSGLTVNNKSISFLYTAGDHPSTAAVSLTFRESENEPAIPEPGTTALLVSGLAGIFFYRRKR